ncbi:hypothetical protein LOK49_LG15G01560 [Camellia lanceoleosa]|uniref:Uncharacterized protein n=1 Tax=Camellia lanceoleosa TaxID=1840588 RepID=A0ACC0F5R7_9ERIC|nr:hypothetical protein LOK49_LG15G01560 [Camellia lanceoleosa]
MLFLLLVGRGVRRTNSPWTRSCERKRQDAASKTTENELGLCEHSMIISPVSAVAFPKFLKWDVATLVTATRGVNLSGHVDFEVTAGRLITKDYEVKIFEVNRVNCAKGAGNAIEEFGGRVHKDDFVDMGVDEVDRLRQANEVQTLYLVGGFRSLMQAKDDEVKKLTTENAELQRVVNVLEDQLAEREVHNVTQAFCGVDVNVKGVKYGLSGNEHVTGLTNNTTPNRVFAVIGDAVPVWDVTPAREQTNKQCQ